MELRHLRYFVVLAEELHFGRAALRLNLSQPPLSQQIQALEQMLGARLFERSSRRVELTEAGLALLGEARATLAQAQRAIQAVAQVQRGEVGELRIGFMPSAPLIGAFTQTILAYRKSRPQVRLALEELVTPRQIEALLQQRLDISFVRSPATPKVPGELATIEVHREPLQVFMHIDHPLARSGSPVPMRALANEPFVFFPPGFGTSLHDQVIGLCTQAGFSPRIEQASRANATILGLVAAGLGVSILPASLMGIAMTKVASRKLASPGTRTSVWLVHRRTDRNPACRAFIAQAISSRGTVRLAASNSRRGPFHEA